MNRYLCCHGGKFITKSYLNRHLHCHQGKFIVGLSTFSNIFSSEIIGPIKVKFHMETPLDAGTKFCSNGPGHMTKMATLPIYGKNPLKKLLQMMILG